MRLWCNNSNSPKLDIYRIEAFRHTNVIYIILGSKQIPSRENSRSLRGSPSSVGQLQDYVKSEAA